MILKLLWLMDWWILMMTNVVGWEGDVERWKKVGISSLSKKLMIRQARLDLRASGNSLVLMCWN